MVFGWLAGPSYAGTETSGPEPSAASGGCRRHRRSGGRRRRQPTCRSRRPPTPWRCPGTATFRLPTVTVTIRSRHSPRRGRGARRGADRCQPVALPQRGTTEVPRAVTNGTPLSAALHALVTADDAGPSSGRGRMGAGNGAGRAWRPAREGVWWEVACGASEGVRPEQPARTWEATTPAEPVIDGRTERPKGRKTGRRPPPPDPDNAGEGSPPRRSHMPALLSWITPHAVPRGARHRDAFPARLHARAGGSGPAPPG